MKLRKLTTQWTARLPEKPREVVLVYTDEDGKPWSIISTVHGEWTPNDGPLPAWYHAHPKS